MKKVAYQSIKLMIVAIATTLLAYLLNVKMDFVIILFFWLLAVLEIPYWVKSNYIDLKTKIILVFFIGLLSIATILYIYGIGKELQNYIEYFFILVVASSIFYCCRKK